MRKSLIAVAAASALLIALTSTVGASVASFTKKNGCELISEDDITEFFGAAPVKTTPDGKKGKFTTCTWRIPAAGGAQFTAFIGIDKPNTLNKKDFKENSKSPDAEKVEGIKKGFYLAQDYIGTVTFIQHGNFVNVQFLGVTADDLAANQDALFELATTLYDEL